MCNCSHCGAVSVMLFVFSVRSLLLAVYSHSKKYKDLETFSKYQELEGHINGTVPRGSRIDYAHG